MKQALFFIVIAVMTIVTYAYDEVHLRSGDIYQGTIYKTDRQGNVFLRLNDGNQRFFSKQEIDTIITDSQTIGTENPIKQESQNVKKEKDTQTTTHVKKNKGETCIEIFQLEFTNEGVNTEHLHTYYGNYTEEQLRDTLTVWSDKNTDKIKYQIKITRP